jgi:N-acetylglucosaminyldiphosphoundecaprenol N-acetyl-beta-D-mannosaminyltransferase
MSVFDVDCFCGRFDEAVDLVIERARSGRGGYVVQCNVHVLMTAQQSPNLMRALQDAWLVMPDGAPVAWLQRRLGASSAERVGGPDLMPAVIDRGRRWRLRHFFLGSTPDVLDSLVDRLEHTYPGVEIVGTFSPPFSDGPALGEAAAVVARSCADLIWVALGAPKQELWLRLNSGQLRSTLALGVGAAFDFHAGAKDRAPIWMQHVGIEWGHRLIREPRRLASRYLTTNSAFVVASFATLSQGRSRGNVPRTRPLLTRLSRRRQPR